MLAYLLTVSACVIRIYNTCSYCLALCGTLVLSGHVVYGAQE